MTLFKKYFTHPFATIKMLAAAPVRVERLRIDNKALSERVEELLGNNHVLTEKVTSSESTIKRQADLLEALSKRLENTDDRVSDTLHQIKAMSVHTDASVAAQPAEQGLLVDNHLLDRFYVMFENNFRGSEEEIKERLKEYLPYFDPIKKSSQKTPVLDIGCGRGEFVEIMRENDIRSIGLDLNKTMVERVIEKGGEAIEADAVRYLQEQPASSLSAITGFHIVEHIPFETLLSMFDECYRTLIKGGFVIFETPNPENVVVGSHSFYMDPSHLHPIPPALLEFAMKTRGFSKVEIVRLHPLEETIPKTKNELTNKMAARMFGPQDYAVIAHK